VSRVCRYLHVHQPFHTAVSSSSLGFHETGPSYPTVTRPGLATVNFRVDWKHAQLKILVALGRRSLQREFLPAA